jgi:hypothetical protein
MSAPPLGLPRDRSAHTIQELDLVAVIAAGHADVPLIELPLRCSKCGKTGHKVIVSGRSYGYDRPRKGAEA